MLPVPGPKQTRKSNRQLEPPYVGCYLGPGAQGTQRLVGMTGVAETLMRPAGAIRVAGDRVQAMAESGIIEKGAQVKVVAAGDQNIIVRLVDSPSSGERTSDAQ